MRSASALTCAALAFGYLRTAARTPPSKSSRFHVRHISTAAPLMRSVRCVPGKRKSNAVPASLSGVSRVRGLARFTVRAV